MTIIIITGNPVEGFTHFGPYADLTDHITDQFEGDWWVAELSRTAQDVRDGVGTEHGFQGARARIHYEWIDNNGQWAESQSSILARTGVPYAETVKEAWAAESERMGGRADRRNIRLEVRPNEPDWVAISGDMDIDSVLDCVADATYTVVGL